MLTSPFWNPTGYLIELAIRKTMDTFSSSAASSDVSAEELNEDATKANIQSSVLQEQAKVEQELSIARRILIAEEVEIEEFYDASGKGGIGLKQDEADGLTLGAHGGGRRITKRVIKFKGFSHQAREMLEQNASPIITDEGQP
ncbi:hypothetical protein ACY2PI_004423 [Citrobacter amalonaticus]